MCHYIRMELLFILIIGVMIINVSGKDLWEMMNELDDMNRQMIEQRARSTTTGSNVEKNIDTTDVYTTDLDSFITKSSTMDVSTGGTVATESSTPKFYNRIIDTEKGSGHDQHSESPQNGTIGSTTPGNNQAQEITASKTTQARNNNKKTTARTITELKTKIVSEEASSTLGYNDVVKLLQHGGDNPEHFVVTNTLIYAGVTSGCLLAILSIVVFVLYRRRGGGHKGRFTTTDQKTYRNTKIFVMGSSSKESNIVQTFDAIPANQNLWKELQSSSPNVF